jgi:hypothetical protein
MCKGKAPYEAGSHQKSNGNGIHQAMGEGPLKSSPGFLAFSCALIAMSCLSILLGGAFQQGKGASHDLLYAIIFSKKHF